jgi:hypothetical protein
VEITTGHCRRCATSCHKACDKKRGTMLDCARLSHAMELVTHKLFPFIPVAAGGQLMDTPRPPDLSGPSAGPVLLIGKSAVLFHGLSLVYCIESMIVTQNSLVAWRPATAHTCNQAGKDVSSALQGLCISMFGQLSTLPSTVIL